MKVLLHIGDAKCGSSSIQASLFSSADLLLEQGLLYHAPRPTNGHFCYITLLNGKTRGDNTVQEKIARENIAETRALIQQHNPEYLLISGENLFNIAPEDLTPLLSKITGEDNEIHVITLLRHPVDLYLSGVQQALRASHDFIPPENYVRATPATFKRWAAFPSCASITTRLFDRKRLRGGSVVSEFTTILRGFLGDDLPELPDANENTSLSIEQIILMQSFRRDFLDAHNGRFMPPSNKLVRFFEELNAAVGLVGTKPKLSAEAVACVGGQNARFIRALDNRFADLRMMEALEVPQEPWDKTGKNWTPGVASILQPHDPGIVSQLKALIPEYNPSLITDPSGAVETLVSLGPKAPPSYLRYLNQCDLGHTSKALRALLPRS